MITRKEYLKEPNKWKNTKEEKELIEFCIEYIKEFKNFHQEFSPEIIDVITKEITENIEAKKTDLFFVMLTKRVLEVYYERIKKGNKGS